MKVRAHNLIAPLTGGLNEYANNVIWAIGDACDENELPHPTVITESGRALTAHHTVLISNVIGVERNEFTCNHAAGRRCPKTYRKPLGNMGRDAN